MPAIPGWLIFFLVWIIVGLLTALWMARRGHSDPAWLAMAVIFGPALGAAASERVRRRPERLASSESGHPRPGRRRLLVGVDGSAQAQTALDLALDLLGPCAQTVVVAEVVDYGSVAETLLAQPGVSVLIAAPRSDAHDR
jgi:hypothetical protein